MHTPKQRRYLTLIGASLISLAGITVSAQVTKSFLPASQGDRLLVVAPHPDDDVLGSGGLLQQAVAAGSAVRIIYLTNGDHNQVAFKIYTHSLHLRPREYIALGERRRLEAIRATGLCGLKPEQLIFLGYPDWGTLRIWRDFWEPGDIFTSDATRSSSVPYLTAYSYGQTYNPENITADLTAIIRDFKPTRVFVTHPADTNPDHRAAANFVRLALLQLAPENIRPALFFYVIHFGNWPKPPHYHPDIPLAPPPALLDDGQWASLPVTLDQAAIKYQAILAHRTQITTRQYYLESFARSTEIFATQITESVPFLPGLEPLDWRRAVRAKSVTVFPADYTPPAHGSSAPPPPTQTVLLEQIEFLRQNDDLIVLAGLKNWLGKRSGVHLYLYGYKHDVPFESMPKVDVNVSPFGKLYVYVAGLHAPDHGVKIATVGNRLIARVPMALLGGSDIDYLFASARAHFGVIAADDTAWELFSMHPSPKATTP